MTATRQQIMGAIRRGLGRGELDQTERAALNRRLAAPTPNLIPERARLAPAAQVDLFATMAGGAGASVVRVDGEAAVPAAVADYLRTHNLPMTLRVAPDPWLKSLPWRDVPLLNLAEGRAEAADQIGLTGAVAAIAETGTLLLASGPTAPTTLNFLPDVHIVAVRPGAVVGALEDAWARLRLARWNDWPRAVNLITGPSRTADIGQELIMGAHGPRRLHIILVDERETAP